jgi:hypothetical protein
MNWYFYMIWIFNFEVKCLRHSSQKDFTVMKVWRSIYCISYQIRPCKLPLSITMTVVCLDYMINTADYYIFQHNHNLHYLNLSNNNFQEQGGVKLAEALGNHNILWIVFLTSNCAFLVYLRHAQYISHTFCSINLQIGGGGGVNSGAPEGYAVPVPLMAVEQ